MNKVIRKNTSVVKVIATIISLMGLALTTYMITVEGEPGALPLFLSLSGIATLIIIRFKTAGKRNLSGNNGKTQIDRTY